MPSWKQKLSPPAGAVPVNIVSRVAVVVITVLMTLLVLVQMLGGGGEEEGERVGGAVGDARVVGSGMVGRLEAELGRLQEAQRAEAARARAAAAEMEADERARGEELAATPIAAGVPAVLGAPGLGGGLPPLESAEEIALRERLRLEALERRERSLRTPSVVQTSRGQEQPGGAGAGGPLEEGSGQRIGAGQGPAGGGVVPPVVPDISSIVDQLQAASALVSGGADVGPVARTVPGVTGPAVEETAGPVTVRRPDDPSGWERVYEGSVLSAVLVGQLDGEFAGPVLAEVAIPFYSRDRQRVLVPRGSRLLGSAQAVQSQDQSRLAVGFHRLVWPDGQWVDLGFHGLSGVGESALRDQVGRHYVSMFAASGAVGLLSGLALQGSNPYGGGLEGFRAGAGQGFGQSATQILQRFLNRLPTVTIRAGHRVRVWVTADFLVPRPRPQRERLLR